MLEVNLYSAKDYEKLWLDMKLKKPSVLIIDDDDDILMTMTKLLSEAGYVTETAKTGAEAIEKSKQKFFNLALIDIVLPDMQGTQLLIKLQETVPKMRKLIITGHATLANAVEAVNLGADAYIIKPINPQEILKDIQEQLQKQKDEMSITQDKVIGYIETRSKHLKQMEDKSAKNTAT